VPQPPPPNKNVPPCFTDLARTDWFYPYIEELADRNLARGNPDGTYAPESPLLVDEFLAFTLRTLGYDLPNSENYWAKAYVRLAQELGLVMAGEYDRYDVPITRGQIAEIVVRASGGSFSEYMHLGGIFTDIGTSVAAEPILKAIELGVLAGYEDRTFRPQNNATRAEASVIVLRMIDEAYRLEYYDGIFFSAKTDLDEKGNMKYQKSQEFLLRAVDDMYITISDNGKAVMNGVLPELPPGQNFLLIISIFDPKGKYLSYHRSDAIFEHQLIPQVGEYSVETKAYVEDIGHFNIKMAVCEGEFPEGFQDPLGIFVIYKYYHETDYDSEGFIMNASGIGRILYYDFELTRGIWGW